MINPVNTWTLTDYNWPIDNTLRIKMAVKQPNNYLFGYRDDLYKHGYGGKWNIFPPVSFSKHVNEWI